MKKTLFIALFAIIVNPSVLARVLGDIIDITESNITSSTCQAESAFRNAQPRYCVSYNAPCSDWQCFTTARWYAQVRPCVITNQPFCLNGK